MTREYFLDDPIHPKGGITIMCKDDTDCVFCEHCTDVFWDYTNLVYMISCEEEHDPWDRPCKHFKESDSEIALLSAESEQTVYCMDCAKSSPLDEHGALWYCKAHDRTTLRHSYCNNGERKGGDDE